MEKQNIITLIKAQELSNDRIDKLSKMGYIAIDGNIFRWMDCVLHDMTPDQLLDLFNENKQHHVKC